MTEPGRAPHPQGNNPDRQRPGDGAPLAQPHYAQAPLAPASQPLAAPAYAAAGGTGAPGAPSPEYWMHAPPVKHRHKGTGLKVTNIILLCVLILVTAGTLTVFAWSIGVSVFLICGALAMIPLSICVAALVWIDRWEPEPKTALLLGFCWGAGMAVITTLILGSWVQPLLLIASNASTDSDVIGAVVQAPLVEELCKGAGVLLLFFLRRRTFDGPVDGLVYAGIIAAGFAFTENILYFGNAWAEGDGLAGALVGTFVMRGLMSPFAHVMFTGALGICVGYAARRGGTAMVLGAWAVGLIPAMLLHGLWNGLTFIGGSFFVMYLMLQVPIFVSFIGVIVLLRRSEAKLTRERLADYVPSGWFSPQEVPMLATGSGRRHALTWAKSFGAGPAMKELIRLATRLAFTRNRLLVDAKGAPGRAGAARFTAAQAQELELLNRSTATRGELLGQHAAALWRARQLQASRYQPNWPPHS
ncbi:PrsW family intramembrane metalloprotease [Arthrobacter sp. AQ5-05]|uniref:PrsW family intramembrane metalloprotease n=1 Tax=Arthrobacter sp. AQ5-05 TaxID=2184581 RepID=UPI0018A6F220|nr:PrsW family intramembrane metalloprotease [Arthrobacter sp. AQ5-05]